MNFFSKHILSTYDKMSDAAVVQSSLVVFLSPHISLHIAISHILIRILIEVTFSIEKAILT